MDTSLRKPENDADVLPVRYRQLDFHGLRFNLRHQTRTCMPVPTKSVSLAGRTTRDLWVGLACVIFLGAVLLCWILPLLFPWQFSLGGLLLLAFVTAFETLLGRVAFLSAAELRRRWRARLK